MTKNPIILEIIKHRKRLVAGSGVSQEEWAETKRLLEEVASLMAPRIAYTIADNENAIREEEQERAEWLAYNLVLDISDSTLFKENERTSQPI